MIKKRHMNRYIGDLPEGCELCMKGAKLVLFVTGLCGKKCYYCPLSEKRRGKDKTWANEVLVKKPQDIIEEAERMRALGAGVTGGDPAARMQKTLKYIGMLKENFEDFHIHMYTTTPIASSNLKALKKAGLDELRFHIHGGELLKSVTASVKTGITTGVEIPAIPSDQERILKIAKGLVDVGGDFLILNELEFSETNTESLRYRGFELKSDVSYAVEGSEETALKVLKSGIDLNIHFCPSRYKDSVQLRKRLLRTAKNTAKDYEEVSKDGLFLKGAVQVEGASPTKLNALRRKLVDTFGVPENLIAVDKEKMRLETTIEIAEKLSELYRKRGMSYCLVEEYPTKDRLETEVIPL